MADKCEGCIFADEESVHPAGWYVPVCKRETDLIESGNARADKEPCPWHITMKKIIDLQDNGLL